jgi:hypothetical protein
VTLSRKQQLLIDRNRQIDKQNQVIYSTIKLIANKSVKKPIAHKIESAIVNKDVQDKINRENLHLLSKL